MTDPAQVAFAGGDFQTASRRADDPVLKGLSLIMLGNCLDGLPLVSRIDAADPATRPETAATVAFGHWLGGNAGEARRILSARRDDPLADAFLGLLSNGPIPCLFQSARAPLLTSMKQVDGFSVSTIGSGGQDCDIDLDDCREADLAKAIREAAFLFCFDFAGAAPDRPGDCSTPFLIHLTDPDVHVLTGLHPVRRYDRAIAGTAGQAAALKAITGVETVCAPFFGGLSAFHPSLAGCQGAAGEYRETDLFFSGSYGTPIYHEKPARFFAVSQIEARFRIELFDSTRPVADYAAALQSARFALVSVRAPGSFSTRAMQALECGAFVLCEADSGIMDYFPGEDWGVFTYRPDHIADDIAGHLARYDEYADRLHSREAPIRDRLAALSPGSPAAEERWLKYAAFQALLIRHAGGPAPRPQCVDAPLDWFTVRGFPSPKDPGAPVSRSAAYSALARRARDGAAPPADWLTDDGAFTPLTGKPAHLPALQADLAGAFLRVAESWVARDRSAFEAAAEAIWQNREAYVNQSLSGLAIPDFWLGVFLNRLGLPLGRLYEEAVCVRMENRPGMEARLLLAALGMAGAERAWAAGDIDRAAEHANAAAALDPANHAAAAMAVLHAIEEDRVPEPLAWDRLTDYPWHLARVLALLTGRGGLDFRLADGKLHSVYLRFVQRMRASRPLLSPAKVPAGAAAYLAWKLDLDVASSAETVLGRLRREHLLLTDVETATPLIVEPVLAALRS